MNKIIYVVIKKIRLIQVVKKAYRLKWFKISKVRRKHYFDLYCYNKYDDLHDCLYHLTGESPHNDRGRAWYFHYDGKWNKDGIGYDIKKEKRIAKQQSKLKWKKVK